MGYESLFFARQHYLELEKRIKEKNLEVTWAASDDLSRWMNLGRGKLSTRSSTQL